MGIIVIVKTGELLLPRLLCTEDMFLPGNGHLWSSIKNMYELILEGAARNMFILSLMTLLLGIVV